STFFSAARPLAIWIPTNELSTAVTHQYFSAKKIALRPVPQAKSKAFPGFISLTREIKSLCGRAEEYWPAAYRSSQVFAGFEFFSLSVIAEILRQRYKIDSNNKKFYEEIIKMQEITATELKEKMDAGEDVQLIDVRQPEEYAFAKIEGAKLI